MFVILQRGERRTNEDPAAGAAIYTVLGIVLMMQWLVDIIAAEWAVLVSRFFVSVALRMMVAVGALVLVHNLYTMSAPEARWGIRLSLAALTAMWTYDLNLYTFSYLTKGDVHELYAMRGCAMAVLVPVLAFGRHRHAR